MIVFPILGTILVLITTFFVFKYKDSFDDIKEEINEYKVVENYFDFCILGFSIIHIFNIDYGNKRNLVIKNCSILYDDSSATLMNYFLFGGQITVLLFGIIISILLVPFLEWMSVVIFLLAILLSYNITHELQVKVNTRNENIAIQLPVMLSKLALLINAGLVLRDAWKIVAFSDNKEIYKEMQFIQNELMNGKSDFEALRLFSERCRSNEVKKFTTVMTQNLQLGSKEIAFVLKSMVSEMWAQKKAIVRRKAQTASQKLLLPAALIFIGILLLILVPLFSQALL